MNGALKPDFVNLQQLFTTRLKEILAEGPHELTDNFGNRLSGQTLGPEAPQLEIILRKCLVARLRAPESRISLLKGMIELAMEAELKTAEISEHLESSQLLSADLDALLDLSESENITLAEMLKHFLRLLRAHVWAERASVFGILDGFTLDGLASLGWEGREDWKTLYSTASGFAATSRKPYVAEDPQKDKNLQGRPGVENLRNLACYPLLHGTSLVGVLNLSNRVGGHFSEADQLTIKRFANVAAHILQKHYLKTKMEDIERANDNLGKYLSKKVAKNVTTQTDLDLGGAVKKVVCLFSDIRGFTTISETLKKDPKKLVDLLNFYFECMHAVIEKNQGTLDKIVGDLIMAVWNIPNDQPDPELLAMRAALEMQKEMIRTVVPKWLSEGAPQVGMGVGVNSGPALVGNLGSTRFMNYTVIGDAVNTTQRLEAKAKAGEVWMAEHIFPFVHGKIEKPVRRELEIRLKGKDETINALVYRPLSS